ncbi:MAG: hypothetical protein ABJP66_07295 [Hyphomicrobiales bacterium]
MSAVLSGRATTIWQSVRARWRRWLGLSVGLTVAYYVLQMAALVLKFGALPNYVVVYNWLGSVWTIIHSTPSISDMYPIIAEEWLIEFGYMNYDFGNGISEWALSIIPFNVVVVFVFSSLIATSFVLLGKRRLCATGDRLKASSAAGLGAVCVAMTSATMSWVVCCATPTWVVGLSMLGLGASTALWLEPVGPWITLLGVASLMTGILILADPSDDAISSDPAVRNRPNSPYQKGVEA